ncbi:MFS transporter [Oceanivirga salmonicida]|uniref:MFS transporter n=1 Tax=Oceanivirga salmonicida TaxID=1769291 RepID=UPI0018D25BCD|nr:MFS transporter [Oceanivirga salmonicida]
MIKIIFSLIMIVVIIIIAVILSIKYKLNKNQKIIFCILVLFWTSISVIRAYRKVYAASPIEYGGLGLSAMVAAQITSAYGLISFLIRMPVFFLTDILGNRKIFIQFAVIFISITSLFVVFRPSVNTLYLSSLAMGVSASMIAIFNVMFSETFNKEDAAVSASILAIAPLLAEFFAAPLQYLGTYAEYKNYYILWIISAIIGIITFILTFFMIEIKSISKFNKEKVKKVITNRKFLITCIVGVVVSFIKFSTSGANMIYYAKSQLAMPSIMLAYLDTIFATPQLIASVLVGTYFKNKFGIEKTLLFSLSSLMIFYLLILFTNDYRIAFIAYAFNGLGYGGTYISLISMAMQYFNKEDRNISMGIFQGFFAFGIFFGDRIYVTLSKRLLVTPKAIFMIVAIVAGFSMLMVISGMYLKKK